MGNKQAVGHGAKCGYEGRCVSRHEDLACCQGRCHPSQTVPCLMDGGHWINKAEWLYAPGPKYRSRQTGNHSNWVRVTEWDGHRVLSWVDEGVPTSAPTPPARTWTDQEKYLGYDMDKIQYLKECNNDVNCAWERWFNSISKSVKLLVDQFWLMYSEVPKDVLTEAVIENNKDSQAIDDFLRKWFYSHNYSVTKEAIDDLRQQLKAMKESRILGPKIKKLRNYCKGIENIDLPFQTYKQIINDYEGDAQKAVDDLNKNGVGCSAYKEYDLSKITTGNMNQSSQLADQYLKYLQ